MTGQTHVVSFEVHAVNLLTSNGRYHWRHRQQVTRILRQVAALEARRQHLPAMQRAHLTVFVSWPTRHRRDVANIHPTLKALIDGLTQDAGALPDDDDTHLIGPDLRVEPTLSGHPGRTLFRFEFKEIP